MSQYLTISCAAQVMDAAQEMQTLMRYLLAAYQVANVEHLSFKLPNANAYTVPVNRIGFLCFLAIRTNQPVDVALVTDNNNNPLFSGKPGNLFLRVWQAPINPSVLILQGPANTTVDLCMAGRNTAT